MLSKAQKKLLDSLETGWLEHSMSGTYKYRSPGFLAKTLNEKTVAAVRKCVPLVSLYCKTPIKGIPARILIRSDRKHLLDGQYVIIRQE